MAIIGAFCLLLPVLTTLIHYEVLRGLTASLARLEIPARAKPIVAILSLFFTHAVEILLYALVAYLVVRYTSLGSLGAFKDIAVRTSIYFSAETYTSLGYGDIVPTGELRLLAGVEALNGLLLIGWSASYIYIAMERFWQDDGKRAVTGKRARRDNNR